MKNTIQSSNGPLPIELASPLLPRAVLAKRIGPKIGRSKRTSADVSRCWARRWTECACGTPDERYKHYEQWTCCRMYRCGYAQAMVRQQGSPFTQLYSNRI